MSRRGDAQSGLRVSRQKPEERHAAAHGKTRRIEHEPDVLLS